MGSELVKKQEIVPAPIVTADNFEDLVREELGKIGEGFLRLGFYFEQAKNCKLYEPLGYDSVFELAEDLFDLKESSVYDMMAVWRWFHSIKNPLALRDDCKGLKYSQLVECLRDRRSGGVVTRVISSTDTVKETRAKVTAWNTLVEKIIGYPSLEQVEREVECMQLRKERKEAENSRRLENSEPEKFQTFGKIEEDPFEDLPKEAEIYADELVKDARAKSNEYGTTDIVPADVQMRVHKRQALSYIETMSQAETAEVVENFFNVAIRRLVSMRAYKLLELKGKKE